MADTGRKPKHTQSRKCKWGDDEENPPEFGQQKKRTLQSPKLTPPETVCFVCQKDGNGVTVSCSFKRCGKIYHLACLNLPESPQGSICFVNH